MSSGCFLTANIPHYHVMIALNLLSIIRFSVRNSATSKILKVLIFALKFIDKFYFDLQNQFVRQIDFYINNCLLQFIEFHARIDRIMSPVSFLLELFRTYYLRRYGIVIIDYYCDQLLN